MRARRGSRASSRPCSSRSRPTRGWSAGVNATRRRRRACTSAIITDLFAPVLRGQDARRINGLWERLFTTERVRGYSTGAQFEALAGVDLALWDLLGKALGLPVYQLLGGKYRNAQPLYRGIGGATTEALVADAKAAVASGMQMVKMSYRKGKGSEDIERVAAVAEFMKPHGQVVGRFARRVQAVRGGPGRAPLRQARERRLVRGRAAARRSAGVSDARGEPRNAGLCRRDAQQPLPVPRPARRRDGADIINPDVCRAGGITECQRIAALADAFNVPWSPHVSTGTVLYFAASLHLALATPNCVIMEGGRKLEGPLGNALVATPLRVEKGGSRRAGCARLRHRVERRGARARDGQGRMSLLASRRTPGGDRRMRGRRDHARRVSRSHRRHRRAADRRRRPRDRGQPDVTARRSNRSNAPWRRPDRARPWAQARWCRLKKWKRSIAVGPHLWCRPLSTKPSSAHHSIDQCCRFLERSRPPR